MGDTAVLGKRSCGCPLDHSPWEFHLSGIRSYEKLTGGGMTFSGVDVIRVLERDLPAAFGGGSSDYQLVEDESAQGSTVLKLLVSPKIGEVDEDKVKQVFVASLGSESIVNTVMSRMWQESGFLSVERRDPIPTKSGKLLHFHVLGRKTVGTGNGD
jgi:hypothetical protein